MKEFHLAQIAQNRADKYKDREVFRFKRNGVYESSSWKEFIEKINNVSRFLISSNITKADNIGIYSQNYPDWTISDLGIMSIRAVVVPVYATASYEQLEYIAKETQMKIIFVGDDVQLENALKLIDNVTCLKKIVTFNCKESNDDRVISIESVYNTVFDNDLSEKVEKQLSMVSIDDLATIIYTSGTTGEPKGVMLNHSNFIKVFEIHEKRLVLGEDDVSMCFLPLSHIFERAWTYFVLYSGAVNVYNVNPKAIIEELPNVKPTVMCAVPRFFEKTYEGIYQQYETWGKAQQAIFDWALKTGLKYIDYQKDSKSAPTILNLKRNIANALVMKKLRKVMGGNIRYMPCAGAAISPEILRFFHAMGLFVNYGYGATETTATVSCMRNDKYDFEYTGSIMPDVEVKIRQEDKMILVKGETVFKGYYNKPEETAKTLIDGWYLTGDQGSIPVKGTLYMSERIKDIMKTSTGKYVSPQKTELLLTNTKYIDQLCVIGDNRKFLTALIVPAYDKLKDFAIQNGLNTDDHNELISHPQINELLQDSIDKAQSDLPSYEKVVKFTLLAEPFTIENMLLTNSLKVRRKYVNLAYADIITNMYS